MKFSAVLLLFAAVTVSPDLRYFRYERPILRPPQSSGQGCLMLDSDLLAHAAPQLADLRLYRDAVETPYAIPPAASIKVGTKPIPPQNLVTRNGQIFFDATMPDLRYSDVQLGVTGQDFIATVTVTGSRQPDRSPETNLGSYTIFDLTSQKLGTSTVLHLPESDFRYLHFRVAGPLSPRSITGVWVMRLPSSQSRYLTVQESSHVVEEEYSTELVFVVPAHVPVDRIAFKPRGWPPQFSRDITISVDPITSVSSTFTPMPALATKSYGTLLRVHSIQSGHRIDEERLVFDAPWVDASTPTRWIVSIKNGDDDPLGLDSVRLEMLERKLCFDAQPNARYTLYYGDPALTAPRYDYAKQFLLQTGAVKLTAGTEQRNPIYKPRPAASPNPVKHPGVL
jgi:hypothetical protein